MARPTPKQETVLLFPNPYHCLGKAGDLGGACPVPEANYGTGRPNRLLVGAQVNAANYDARDHLTGGDKRTAGVKSRADIYFTWGVKPVSYAVTSETRAAFAAIVRDEEVFKLDPAKPELPMQKLALARLKLIGEHDDIGDHPHKGEIAVDWWNEQFPLDAKVAEYSDDAVEMAKLELEERRTKRAELVAAQRELAEAAQKKLDAQKRAEAAATAKEVATAADEALAALEES